MGILKVARMGHPVLRQVAEPVKPEEVVHPDTQRLIRDMVETMFEYRGAGLAAPQVHVSRRIVVVRVPEAGDAEAGDDSREAPEVLALINPEIRPVSEDLVVDWEGCLSLPDLRGRVPRFEGVRASALTPHGTTVSFEVDGFAARAIQHEVDHLDGVLYPDRMPDLRSLSFLDEYVRYGSS